VPWLASIGWGDQVVERLAELVVALRTDRLAPFGLDLRMDSDGDFMQAAAARCEPNNACATVVAVAFER